MKMTLVIISALCCLLGTSVQGINGGADAQVGQFKYIVAIDIERLSEYSLCAGSIIADRFILTAAHCFTDDDKKNEDGTYSRKFNARAAAVFANVIGLDEQDLNSANAIKRKGVSVYFVPEHFENGVTADIAVLELDSALSFKDGLLEKLVIPGLSVDGNPSGNPSDTPSSYENAEGVLAAYGDDKVGKDNHKLKWINMNVVPYQKCRYGIIGHLINNVGFVCGQGVAAPFSGCPGDSGAPLVVKDNDEPKNAKTVVGVYNGGGNCSHKMNDPNVFIRVSHHSTFISDVIMNADRAPKIKYEL